MPPSRTQRSDPQPTPSPNAANAGHFRPDSDSALPWDPHSSLSTREPSATLNTQEISYCSTSSMGWDEARTPSRSRRVHPYAEASTSRSLVARKSGTQVLCNSSNFSVGCLEVNNVAGDAHNYYFIDAEGVMRFMKGTWTRFKSLFTSLPPTMRFSEANSLIFTDALGVTVTLHHSSVRTYEDLERFIAFHFKGKIGEGRVRRRRYRIAGTADGTLVKREDWERAFEERKHLVMSMLIEQIYLKELDGTCPKCDETELGTYVDQGWTVCRRCNGRCLPTSDIWFKEGCGVMIDMQPDAEEAYFRHVVKTRVRLWFDDRIPRDEIERELSRRRKERRMNADKSRFQELDN